MKKRVKSSNVFGEKQKLIIAKILINLRELNFLTQTDIAKHLHLSPSTISHYEKGLTVPPTEVVYRLADFYNVTTDYILGKSASRTNLNDTYNVPLVKTQMKKIIVTAKTLYSHPKNVSKIYAALHTDLAW